MTDAIALYQGPQVYKEASAAFAKLAQAKPNDARVLYFAALASGFSTNNWNSGDAASLAKKGVEREKAGTPEPDQDRRNLRRPDQGHRQGLARLAIRKLAKP